MSSLHEVASNPSTFPLSSADLALASGKHYQIYSVPTYSYYLWRLSGFHHCAGPKIGECYGSCHPTSGTILIL